MTTTGPQVAGHFRLHCRPALSMLTRRTTMDHHHDDPDEAPVPAGHTRAGWLHDPGEGCRQMLTGNYTLA